VQQRVRLCGALPASAITTLSRKYLAWDVKLTDREHSRPALENPARLACLPNLPRVTLLAGGFPIATVRSSSAGLASAERCQIRMCRLARRPSPRWRGRSRPFSSGRSAEEGARSGIDSVTQKVYVHSTPDADGGNSGRAVQPTPTGDSAQAPTLSAFGFWDGLPPSPSHHRP
jgi:hypothetical protein